MKRVLNKNLKNDLMSNKAVLIRGVRGCGKTTLANEYVNSSLDMRDKNNVEIAYARPELLLNSEKPMLIDEYGNAPLILETIKGITKNNGDFILTNSADLLEQNDEHLKLIDLKPMSLYESNESNGLISLEEILKKDVDINNISCELDYEKIAYSLCRGGFPELIDKKASDITKSNNKYIETLISEDINKIDGVKRNSKLAYDLLKTYSNQISTLSTDRELIDETIKNYGKVSDKTIYNYVKQLKRLFIIEEIKGWEVSFRNKTTVRLSPKKFFVDPSIGTTLLGMEPKKLMMNFELYNKLFENLVYRDLNVYASSFGGKVKYYQDRYGLNSDFVIELENDEYALVDVQLSERYIEESEKHLLKIKKLVEKETSVEKTPKKMIIITSGTEAKILESGILVVPIGCLKN